MKNLFTLLLTLLTVVLFGCSSVLDNQINSKDYADVVKELDSTDTLSIMKRKYIKDNLGMYVGILAMAEGIAKNTGKGLSEMKNVSTFRSQIDSLSIAYDSKLKEIQNAKDNNKKLRQLIVLTDASATPISEYKGYLGMKVKFNNQFDKEILYAILNYKYTTKYDQVYFDENTRLIDEVANNFTGEVDLSTSEEYNSVADFLYTKVPIKNKKVTGEYLMKGMTITPLLVVFKDKTEVAVQDTTWEYFETPKPIAVK
jgi:hypothetical protein